MGIGLAVARVIGPSMTTFDVVGAALAIATSLAVLVGLFTSVSAAVLAVTIAVFWFPVHGDVLGLGMPAALMTFADAVAVSLIGPGAFSIDARLFGPREIVISRGERAPDWKEE